jgi:two-component system, NarL family, nitrate/nitrite response regulator NarL
MPSTEATSVVCAGASSPDCFDCVIARPVIMRMQSPARVVVVDDHPGIRAGISSLIDGERPSMCSVGFATNAEEALTQVKLLQPDVVVLDVNLAGEDGLVLIPIMQSTAPCEIVVLTSLIDPRVAAHAQRLGAHACVHKAAPATDLLACILSAHAAKLGRSTADGPANAGSALSHVDGDQTPSQDGQVR